jgi:hypothetical protein
VLPQKRVIPGLLSVLLTFKESYSRKFGKPWKSKRRCEGFTLGLKDVPRDAAAPDGAFRIKQTSRELSTARVETMRAHRRLNEFLSREVIPEDVDPADSGFTHESFGQAPAAVTGVSACAQKLPSKV